MLGLGINVVVALAFFVYGILLSRGRGASLLSGYNTMAAEKKAKIDELALCRFMAKIMYALACCVGLFAISEWLERDIIFIIGLGLFIVVLVFALIYVNTGNRFIKEK